MEKTIYNPQKGRLEMIQIEFTDANTTWFDQTQNEHPIYSITDFGGGLVISEYGYDYPVWIYDATRASIGYSSNRALRLRKSTLQSSCDP